MFEQHIFYINEDKYPLYKENSLKSPSHSLIHFLSIYLYSYINHEQHKRKLTKAKNDERDEN